MGGAKRRVTNDTNIPDLINFVDGSALKHWKKSRFWGGRSNLVSEMFIFRGLLGIMRGRWGNEGEKGRERRQRG